MDRFRFRWARWRRKIDSTIIATSARSRFKSLLDFRFRCPAGAGLQRVLRDYFVHYLHSGTHLALDKDTPLSRSVAPPLAGRVVATPQGAACTTARTASAA